MHARRQLRRRQVHEQRQEGRRGLVLLRCRQRGRRRHLCDAGRGVAGPARGAGLAHASRRCAASILGCPGPVPAARTSTRAKASAAWVASLCARRRARAGRLPLLLGRRLPLLPAAALLGAAGVALVPRCRLRPRHGWRPGTQNDRSRVAARAHRRSPHPQHRVAGAAGAARRLGARVAAAAPGPRVAGAAPRRRRLTQGHGQGHQRRRRAGAGSTAPLCFRLAAGSPHCPP